MKRYFYLTLLMMIFFISSCKKQERVLTVLSDDIFMLDAAALFQAENPDFTVQVTLTEKSKNGIFSNTKKNETVRYDLIAGEYFPYEPLSSSRFAKIELYDNQDFYRFELDFHQKTKEIGVIYSCDFPVIVGAAGKDNLPDAISSDDFQKISLSESNTENGEEEFAFVPQMTSFPEIEFYFIGQDLYSFQDGKYVFSIDGVNTQFQRYHFFNQTIADERLIQRYIRRNEKLDVEFYIRNGIQRYDIRYFSEAKTLPSDKYKIHFISDNSTLSLKQNVIAVNKLSFSKKEAAAFVNFLLSYRIQEYLYNESSTLMQALAYKNIHFPVISGIIDDSTTDNYISDLRYSYFGDEKQHQKFMNVYNTTMDLIARDRLKKEDFADFINKQID